MALVASVVKWRRHGRIAQWFLEKTPPNSGGVASCRWRSWRRAENDGFFLFFVYGRSWADPTQPYPIIHSKAQPSSPTHLLIKMQPSNQKQTSRTLPSTQRPYRDPPAPSCTQPHPAVTPSAVCTQNAANVGTNGDTSTDQERRLAPHEGKQHRG